MEMRLLDAPRSSGFHPSPVPFTRCRRVLVSVPAAPIVALILSAWVALPLSARAESPLLDVEGMTFVASRDNENEMVLHADHARFHTDEERVFLQDVHMVVEPSDYSGSFEIFCDEGQLDMATNDFEARGNVRGTTDGGRAFSAPWVQYDHEQGLLFTNAPVLINEDAITYRGGGFQYYVRSKRFRLLGGASVVQEQ